MFKFALPLFLISSICHSADYQKLAERSVTLLRTLVEAETTGKDEEKVVNAVKKRFDSAGIPYEITEFAKGRKNIVARLKGNGSKKPMLILAHSDVVSATNQPWSFPPHKITEKDGFLYGRGVVDDLGYVAVVTELLVEIKNNKTVLDRDIIVAITGDEEKGGEGAKYLVANKRSSIDAEFALNEGGAGMLYEDGNVEYIALSAAEKIYQDFKVTATGTAGHSSTPNNDNPINRLSEGLARLAKFKEPIQIIPVVESSLRARVPLEKDPALKKAMLAVANKPKNPPKDAIALLEKNPMLNAILKRTCVVTVVQAGAINMKNVLPSTAYANVNCRLLPGQEIADTKEKLVEIFADPKITVEEEPAFGHSEASSLDNPVVLAANEVSKKMFKNVPVVPSLLTGGTDSRFLRATGIPSYGIGPIFVTPSDRMFVHGANERMRPKILPVGIEFFHNLILVLAEKK